MLRSPLLILLYVFAVATAPGRTLHVGPGEIAAGLEIPACDVNLTLTGRIDASDLDRMAGFITDITTLDLSGTEIVAYSGPRFGSNMTSAPESTLPAGILAGLRVSHLILPESLTAICDGALMDSRITDIVIPENVSSIGRSTFANCTSLRSITLPASLTALPDRMAEGCEALTTVNIPPGVVTIGSRAFFGCRGLEQIGWPAPLCEIGEEAFALSGLTSADLSRCTSLTTIGARAFASCPSLSAASLPENATDIGQGVFFECRSLQSVRLPDSTVSIPPLTLKGAENITTIELPTGIVLIDTLAFAGMTGVHSLTLPSTVTDIADGAFENWSGLNAIDGSRLTLVPALGEDVWAGVNQSEVNLTVDRRLENLFLTTPQWQDFVIGHTSGITQTDSGLQQSVSAGFNGTTLTVTSTVPLARVELYAVDGRLLTLTDMPDDNVTTIDTSSYTGPFFIVRATPADDNPRVTLKLMRLN
ncbi:MAG: leucine-rich repeat domain-containing protein [Duncaniella sp.]|nr:leucine-rich repeat domain-containing protein [Duncaniella sp.]